MSNVTNLILHIGIAEDENQKIAEVNMFFDDQRPLVSIKDESLPDGWYGGTKHLECNLYVGAFNYLNLERFVAHLKTIRWGEPEALQLIKEEGDDWFSILNVYPEKQWEPEQTQHFIIIAQAMADSEMVYNDNSGLTECCYCTTTRQIMVEPLQPQQHDEDCPVRLAAAWLEKHKVEQP
jgi:hypothetical protein